MVGRGGFSAVVILAGLALTGCKAPPPNEAPTTHAQLIEAAQKAGPGLCDQEVNYINASADLARADAQLRAGDARRADILLREGLAALGPFELGSDFIDDTGMQLTLARSREWEGDYSQAATIRRGVLNARLGQYAEVKALSKCPTPDEAAARDLAPPPEIKP